MTTESGLTQGRILIEGHNLTLASGTGIATYARHLAAGLRGLGFETELLVGSNRNFDPKDQVLTEVSFFDAEFKPNLGQNIGAFFREWLIGPFGVKAYEMPAFMTVVGSASDRFQGFSNLLAVPHLETKEFHYFRRYGTRLSVATQQPPRLFHATRPTPIKVRGCPNIYTIHDIVPLRLPYTTLDDKKLHLNIVRNLCKTADHIVTVSEFSRQDIIKLTGMSEDRITNTYQAVQLPQRLMARDESVVAREIEALFGLEMKSYFLFVGAIEPKKNLGRLIDAYAASGVDRPLIVAGGGGWLNDSDIEKMKSERFLSYRIDGTRIRAERSIKRLNYLPLDHLVSLIRGARALLFPSLYEGFGLPVLEAMMLGTPVMTSNVSSLPEVAGDAARLVDPYDIEAMSAAIRELDADADLRAALTARGLERASYFSPERYSTRLSQLYQRLLS